MASVSISKIIIKYRAVRLWSVAVSSRHSRERFYLLENTENMDQLLGSAFQALQKTQKIGINCSDLHSKHFNAHDVQYRTVLCSLTLYQL